MIANPHERAAQFPSAEEAVREAVRVTRDSFLIDAESKQQDAVLVRESEAKCRFGSVNALFHLVKNYAHLFPHLFLIEARSLKGSPFVQDPTWLYHTFFLANGADGRYYAASPGNYKPGQSGQTPLIVADSLNTAVLNIENTEGGKWPSPGYVQQIADGLYFPPVTDFSPQGNPILLQQKIVRYDAELHGAPIQQFTIFTRTRRLATKDIPLGLI